jgi:Plasmid replication region DNA-binding N-term
VSRQFTDGEIVAAIRAIAAEGATLSRAAVRSRLGGGGSTRISALLKEYGAVAHGPPPRSGPTAGPIEGPAAVPTDTKAPPADGTAPAAPPPSVDRETNGSVARLESEIRVLKILLESERNARREGEARFGRTVEALQREIEIAGRCWSDRSATQTARPWGTPRAQKPRSKTKP